MVIVRSPASATVINAISTGKGSAFGIKLYVTAEAKVVTRDIYATIDCDCESLDDPDMDKTLMDMCVRMVYDRLTMYDCFNLSHIRVSVRTKSDIPPGSGLSSSSAVSNSVVMATFLELLEEAGLTREDVDISDEDLLNIGIDASLDAGVTKTGSYDDASASFYGGWKITDNYRRQMLYEYTVPYDKILIYIPNKSLYTAQADVSAMKTLSSLVEIAFDNAVNKDIEKALTLNGFLYCAALDLDSQISMDALKSGATAAGLSGTGSAYSILISNDMDADEIMDSLSKYPGRLILTSPDNVGSIELEKM